MNQNNGEESAGYESGGYESYESGCQTDKSFDYLSDGEDEVI